MRCLLIASTLLSACASSPDLLLADLAMPDLAMSSPDLLLADLAMPDLAVPDLAMPDLVTPSQCLNNVDCSRDGGARLQCCNGICVDTTSDKLNCGGCGMPCQGGWSCCQSVCSSTTSDVANCGACGAACNLANVAVSTCAASRCSVAVCNTHFADCDEQAADGCEVNTQTDVKNCGACGTACAFANATSACALGACSISMCNPNYADCNKLAADGCEVNTLTDANNCGGCALACSLANATPTCTLGACAISTCNATCADCNKLPADGCEVNLQTDAKNCGACDAACNLPNAVPNCAAGACTTAMCSAGYADCNKSLFH